MVERQIKSLPTAADLPVLKMWRNCVCVALAAVCLGLLVQTRPSDTFHVHKRTSRFCGRNLSDTLAYLCNGVYNSKFSKKSDEGGEVDYDLEQQQRNIHFPFLSRSQAALFIPNSFRRFARGVYDECCRKPCSVDELLTYCSRPAKTTTTTTTEASLVYVEK